MNFGMQSQDEVKYVEEVRNYVEGVLNLSLSAKVEDNPEREHRLKVLRESVEYYIKKPVDTDYLYCTVKNLNRLLTIKNDDHDHISNPYRDLCGFGTCLGNSGLGVPDVEAARCEEADRGVV